MIKHILFVFSLLAGSNAFCGGDHVPKQESTERPPAKSGLADRRGLNRPGGLNTTNLGGTHTRPEDTLPDHNDFADTPKHKSPEHKGASHQQPHGSPR